MTDDLIDLVARDLTAAPARDLAGAVNARIAVTPQLPVWQWRLATLSLVSAAGVIVVLVLRTSPVTAPPITAVAPPAPPSAVAASSGADMSVSTAASPTAAATRSSSRACPEPCRRAARVRAISQVEAEWQSRAVAALVPSAPLTIDPIQPGRLTIPLMQIEPIGTTPIELTPVGTAGGR